MMRRRARLAVDLREHESSRTTGGSSLGTAPPHTHPRCRRRTLRRSSIEALLERQVQEVYRGVARDPFALRARTGRSLWLHLGYPEALLDPVPESTLASLQASATTSTSPGSRRRPRARSRVGLRHDAFCAAIVGDTGRVVGVDFTDAQVAAATTAAERSGIANVQFVEAASMTCHSTTRASTSSSPTASSISRLSSIASSPRPRASCAQGGRLAISDIVSANALKESTRRNTELWAPALPGRSRARPTSTR